MKHTIFIIALIIFFSPLLSQAVAESHVAVVSGSGKSKIELVFVLDTTGSMGGLIQAAKDKIWSIANTMATAKPAPEIKIGLVGYRDRGDSYVTTISEMTYDLDRVYQTLMGFNADGGGDSPESVNQALFDAVHKNDWSHDNGGTYKVIFLVGDAPPHMDYQDDVKYQTTCGEAAKKGIIINTIQCGYMGETEPIWKDIAQRCDGAYFKVSQGGDAKDYKTPYDKEIREKSKRLEETKVYYGDRSFHEKNRKKLEAIKDIYESAKPSAIAKRSSYNLSESGKENFLGKQELVDSVTSGKMKLEDIKEDELPESMQKMTVDEREKYLEKMLNERRQIVSDLKKLSEKRQGYIQDQVKKEKDKGENSLDMKLYKCIQSQAAEKSIEYTDTLKY